MKQKHAYILLGILLLAVFFRFYLIKEMPGGLFPDEAANGLDINLMDQGYLQPFYERGNGRESLFFYMLWGTVTAFGRGPWQHHIVSGLVGVLAVLGCFLVTRVLFSGGLRKNGYLEEEEEEKSLSAVLSQPIRGPGEVPTTNPRTKLQLRFLATQVLESKAVIVALIASFLMAVSSWHVVLSRTAFRANLIPLIATFTFFFGLKIFTETDSAKKIRWSILFGVCFALGFYTYIAYRIMAPVLIIVVLWAIIGDIFEKPRLSGLKKYFTHGLVALFFFALTFAPIGYYFYTHSGSFVGRSGQVSIFNPELNGGHLGAAIMEVTKQSFLGYFTQGDLNWRHNISGAPFLSPFISPFFAVGLLLVTFLAVRYAIRPHKYASDLKHFILAGWFYAMLLPVITTAEGIPHGLRSIGTIPVVFIITGYGIYMVYTWIIKLNEWRLGSGITIKAKIIPISLKIITVAFAIILPLQTYSLYFVKAYNDPANFFAFRSDLTTVSEYLITRNLPYNTYLIVDKFSVQTTDYLTSVKPENACDRTLYYRPKDCVHDPSNMPYVQIDPEDSWRASDFIKDGKLLWQYGLKSGDEVVFTQSSIFDIKKFKEAYPNTQLVREVRNKFDQAIMAVYEMQ